MTDFYKTQLQDLRYEPELDYANSYIIQERKDAQTTILKKARDKTEALMFLQMIGLDVL